MMSNQDRQENESTQVAKNEDSINTKDFVIGALIGGIVGAGTALLLAPKSGKELISDINTQASQLKEKSSHIADTAKVKGTEWVQVAKEKSNEIVQSAKEKSSDLQQTVSKQSADMKDKIKQMTAKDDAVAEENAPTSEAEAQKRLEETKVAFDQTEEKVNQ